MERKRDPKGIPTGGRFAEENRPESDVNLAAPAEGVWIRIERENSDQDLTVGPYPDEESAEKALEDSLLIDGFCEEDCLDAYVDTDQPTEDDEQVIVDLGDPHHTGVEGEDFSFIEAGDIETVERLDARYGNSISDSEARAGLHEANELIADILLASSEHGVAVGEGTRDAFERVRAVGDDASREDVIAAYDQALTLASSLTGRERYSPEQRGWARHRAEAQEALAKADHPIAHFEASQDIETMDGYLVGRLDPQGGWHGVPVTDRESLEARIAVDDVIRQTYPDALSWRTYNHTGPDGKPVYDDEVTVNLPNGLVDDLSIRGTPAEGALARYGAKSDASQVSYARPDFDSSRLRSYLEGMGVDVADDESPKQALAWALGDTMDYNSGLNDAVKASRPEFTNADVDAHITRFLDLRGVKPEYSTETPAETLGWALGDQIPYEDISDLV